MNLLNLSTSLGMAAVALASCSRSADDIDVVVEPITGQVVDSHLRPVPAAVVAVKYEGTIDSLSETSSRCVKATAVQADAQGNFVVPGWSKKYVRLRNIFASFQPYKPGFERIGSSPIVKGTGLSSESFGRKVLQMHADNVVVALRPFSGLGVEDRREFLGNLISSTSCSDPDIGGMRPLYEAIYSEAKEMPPETPIPGHATLLELAATMSHESVPGFAPKK